jgi:glutamate-ammonia-ligase adenylyltransferase
VVSGPPAFAARVEEVIRAVLCRKRDPAAVRGCVEMRQAIAKEKGEDARWDLKYAAGGLIDLEFIAQYLQLVHAAEQPEILDTNTARVFDKAWRLGCFRRKSRCAAAGGAALSQPDADPAALPAGPFDPKTAGQGFWDCLQRGRSAEFRHARMRMSPKRSRRCARPSIGYWLLRMTWLYAVRLPALSTHSINEALRT